MRRGLSRTASRAPGEVDGRHLRATGQLSAEAEASEWACRSRTGQLPAEAEAIEWAFCSRTGTIIREAEASEWRAVRAPGQLPAKPKRVNGRAIRAAGQLPAGSRSEFVSRSLAHCARSSPVAGHQLFGPYRLADDPARGKAEHVRLEVEDRRAVDRIEARTLRARPSTPAISHVVRPRRLGRFFPACAKMPILGQSVRPRGWAGAGLDLGDRDAVKVKEHLDVAEGVEAASASGANCAGRVRSAIRRRPNHRPRSRCARHARNRWVRG